MSSSNVRRTSDSREEAGLEASLNLVAEYARRQIPVVMLFGIVTDGAGRLMCECPQGPECPRPGKHPRRRGWKRSSTTNEVQLRALLKAFPDSNLGIATGPIVVLDFDPRHESDSSEEKLLAEAGAAWPVGPVVRTGGDGKHLYFDANGWRVGNSIPALSGAGGIDVRGRGGYVVAPPSRHVLGSYYSWDRPISEPLPPLPAFLTRGLVADLAALEPPPNTTSYAWAALASEYESVATAKTGTRNRDLFAAACRLGELVAGGAISEDLVSGSLVEAADLCGLSQLEAIRTISSGLERGKRSPRSVRQSFNNREEALRFMEEMRAVVQRLPWSGHAGKRQVTVLEALIRIAMRAGGPGNFAKGIRGIAQEAGIASYSTVLTAIEELQRAGWLTRLFRGDAIDRPSRWRLHIPEQAMLDLGDSMMAPDEEPGGTVTHPQLPVGHDAFRRSARIQPGINRVRGLDKTAWRVLELLAGNRYTTRVSIAKALGIHPSTAGRVVKKLMDLGIVAQTESGIEVTARVFDLDEVARELGTFGAALYQRIARGWQQEPDPPSGIRSLPELVACPHRPPCDDSDPPCDH